MILAIEHAGAVLALFSAERPEWGASSAGRALGLSKSGSHHLLVSLASIGLLRRAANGRFRLGWRALELARTIGATDELVATAIPVMAELVRVCGHPVALGGGSDGVVVAVTDERGTHVGGSSWFPRDALREALLRGDADGAPLVVRRAHRWLVAMEIDHGRPDLPLAVGTALAFADGDRARWVAAAAAKIGHRLRTARLRQRPPALSLSV